MADKILAIIAVNEAGKHSEFYNYALSYIVEASLKLSKHRP